MKALNKQELFKLLDDKYPGDYTIIFEDELQELMKEYGENWFFDTETDSWIRELDN